MSETQINSDDAKDDRGANTSGCCVFSAIVTVFGGLVILYVAIYFVQRKFYDGFTQDAPAEIKLLEPDETQLARVQAKLTEISKATETDARERILFTSEDINIMIASLDLLKDFRGNTYVESISDRGIETLMSQSMRKVPMTPDTMHLNAKFILWPELRRRTVAMRVSDIEPFVGTIPEGFVESFDSMSMMKFDPEIPQIKKNITKISRIYLEPPHLVVETGPPATDQPQFKPKK